jgi:hypothetical protein
MVERDPIGNDARDRRLAGKLGGESCCLLCGERELPALHLREVTLRRLPPRLLSDHHLAGEANDPDATVRLCRNCHAKVTWMQMRSGIDLFHDDGRAMPEKLVQFLYGLAMMFSLLADVCERSADRLQTLVHQLDQNQPGWRGLPAAEA